MTLFSYASFYPRYLPFSAIGQEFVIRGSQCTGCGAHIQLEHGCSGMGVRKGNINTFFKAIKRIQSATGRNVHIDK